MFFVSAVLFAWLVFPWYAALPMMLALMSGIHGAPPRLSGGVREGRGGGGSRGPPRNAPSMCTRVLPCADMYKYALRLIRKFHLRADEMVTGKFEMPAEEQTGAAPR